MEGRASNFIRWNIQGGLRIQQNKRKRLWCWLVLCLFFSQTCTYFCVSPHRWRSKDFSCFLSFILSCWTSHLMIEESPSVVERVHMAEEKEKSQKNHFAMAGIQTHDLSSWAECSILSTMAPCPCWLVDRQHCVLRWKPWVRIGEVWWPLTPSI